MKDDRKLIQSAANPCRIAALRQLRDEYSFCIHNQGGTASQVLVPAIGMRAFFVLKIHRRSNLA
ncbi:hypothetical protein BIV60_01745 [Bacillus sp. MUM 116]|nr:hypothetical protein BIV60_01745 [Bacillus sp. MUM 116]